MPEATNFSAYLARTRMEERTRLTLFGSDGIVSHAILESRRFAIDSAAGT
jgi:hypothetical protein